MTLNNLIIRAAGAVIFLISNYAFSERFSYIEPPMVKIKAGSFLLGSETYEDSQPVKKINLSSFYVGKYEVTIKEFSYFVKDTKFPLPKSCYHQIGYWWFENESEGSWSDNDINTSPFEPVSCIGYQAAKAYTQWLSEKTGKPYRLLSEAEWEYISMKGKGRENTSICEQANLADLRAESYAQIKLNTSYVNLIGIEKCDDKSPTVSVVGKYKPNLFGIYDLIGNVNEFVEDCYQNSYENMPDNGQAIHDKNCKSVVLRGGAWHWPEWDFKIRDAKPINWIGVLEGFRLAMDDKGIDYHQTDSEKYFQQQLDLTLAKTNAKAPTALPEKISHLKLLEKNDIVNLSWEPLPLTDVEYVVLANSYFNGRYAPVATVVEPHFKHVTQHKQKYQYVVAAKIKGEIGEYSEPVSTQSMFLNLFDSIEAEHFDTMKNAIVFPLSKSNQIVTGPRAGSGETSLTYKFISKVTQPLKIKLLGKGSPQVKFDIIVNRKFIGSLALSGEGAELEMPVTNGRYELKIVTQQAGWQLDAISIEN